MTVGVSDPFCGSIWTLISSDPLQTTNAERDYVEGIPLYLGSGSFQPQDAFIPIVRVPAVSDQPDAFRIGQGAIEILAMTSACFSGSSPEALFHPNGHPNQSFIRLFSLG